MATHTRYITVCFFLLASLQGAQAQIELSNQAPVLGEIVTLTLPEATSEVEIVYRPNSQVMKTDTLRSATPTDSFQWTPKNAGIVAISAVGVSKNVSVRFGGISWSGIFVMILAAFLLFGGATVAFRTLFRDEEEDGTIDLDIEHLPDT